MSSIAGRVVVYGGKGALGSSCVSHFKAQNWWVGSIDMKENEQADINIIVKTEANWLDQEKGVIEEVSSALKGEKLDAIICVAGGWAGGNAAAKDFIQSCDLMWRQSVWSSAISASLAAAHLNTGGFLALTGAAAAAEPTPGMIGYGVAKAAVHQLTRSLGAEKGGLPANSCALAILPVTLDTPMNRKWMPNADHTTWTPLTYIAEQMYSWAKGGDRPKSGSLLSLITKNGETQLVPV